MRAIPVLMLSLGTLLAQQSPPPPADTPKVANENVARLGASGVTAPRLIKQTKPNYTSAAMRARIQGVVTLECVIETDGSVGRVRVIRSLDAQFGLDEEAIRVVKQWRFLPGTKDGTPVRVLVTVEMSFTLRERDGSMPAAAGPATGPALPGDRTAAVGWPEWFVAAEEPSTASWTEDTIATPTIDVHYAYPPQWSVLKSSATDRLVTLYADNADGTRTVTISQPQPSPYTFTEPVRQATLDSFAMASSASASFLSNAKHIKSGQVLRRGGLWLWFEMAAPSFAAWNAPGALAERLRTGSYDGIHVWTFATTAAGQSVSAFCAVVHHANASDADKQEEIRRAGLEFGSILKRIVILSH